LDACARCATSRWDGAPVPLLEPRRAPAQIRGDRRAAGGEQAHHLPGDALDLEPVPVISRDPLQAEPGGEGLLQVLGDDRGDRADVLVVAQRVRRPPLPVRGRSRDVRNLGMDMQLHVAVPGGVLQPVRHRQVRFAPLAGLPAMHPPAVRPGAGVARLALEIFEADMYCLPDHLVDLADQGGPVLIAVLVAGLAGQPGVLAEGGVEDRDALGQRQGQIKEQRALPGLPDRLDPQLALTFGGSVRLGGQELGVQVGSFAAITWRPPQPGAIRSLALTEQQVIRLALHPLPELEPERLRAGSPPPAGRFSPGLAGLDVIAGRVPGRAAVNVLPDVVKVIALAQRRHNCH
jgi:hypothetical protein